MEAFARGPDRFEQFQRDQDIRRQLETRDVEFLLVEVIQERVVGRAQQVVGVGVEDLFEVTAGVFALVVERPERPRNENAPFQMT